MSKKRSFSPVPGGAVAASRQMAVQQIAFAGKFSVLARPKGLGFAHHERKPDAVRGLPISPVPPVRPADSPPARGPARGLSERKTCRRHVFFTLGSEVRVPSLNKKTGSSLLRTSCFGAPEGTRTPDLLIRSQTLYPAELRAHLVCRSFKLLEYNTCLLYTSDAADD